MKAPRLRSQITFLIIFCFAFLASISHAQDYEFIAQHEGKNQFIGTFQNYIYFNSGGNIHVLKYDEENQFTIENSFRNGYNSFGSISIDSNFMYLSVLGDGILIYDLTDAERPVLIGNTTGEGKAIGSIISDTLLIAYYRDKVNLFDISNIEQAEHIKTLYYELNVNSAYSLGNNVLYGYMQVDYGGSDFIIGYDLSNLPNPNLSVYQGLNNSPEPCQHCIESKGDLLFLALRDTISIYDISSPNSLQLISKFSVPNEIRYLKIEGDTAFVAVRDSIVYLYNISELLNVQLINSYKQVDWVDIIEIDDNYLITGMGTNSVRVRDMLNPLEQYEFEYSETDAVSKMHIKGDLGYFLTSEAGLQIIDLRNDYAPIKYGNIKPFPSYASKIISTPNHLYISTIKDNDRINIIDVTDSLMPEIVSEIITDNDYLSDFCINNNHLYLFDGSKQLEVYDISIPENPVMTNSFSEDGRWIDVFDSLLVVYEASTFVSKIKLLRLNNNGELILEDEINLHDTDLKGIRQIEIDYPFIYASALNGIVIFEISSDNKLLLYNDLLLEGYSEMGNMVYDDNYFYLSGKIERQNTIAIIDKTDFNNLKVFQEIFGSFHYLAIRPNHIYCAQYGPYYIFSNDFSGLEPISDNYDYFDINLYPNPCSNSTTINLSKNKGTNSKLEIYSLSGSKVFEVDITYEKNILVNTSDFSLGFYLVKYSSGKNIVTRKLVVAK